MTVAELKKQIESMPDDALVVFQGNESNDEDEGDFPTYTTVTGTVYEAWLRTGGTGECVIDCAVLLQE